MLKAVIAKYTAEEIITKRGEVKAGVDDFLTSRLAAYHIAVDDVSLVHVQGKRILTSAQNMLKLSPTKFQCSLL